MFQSHFLHLLYYFLLRLLNKTLSGEVFDEQKQEEVAKMGVH